MIGGLLFPFGLGMVMLMGAELFTGNVMIGVSVLEGRTTLGKMMRNWVLVYAGNSVGAAFTALACAWFGQMDYSGGGLAVYAIRVAVAKCTLPFGQGVVLGIFCNILVCTGVLCSLASFR